MIRTSTFLVIAVIVVSTFGLIYADDSTVFSENNKDWRTLPDLSKSTNLVDIKITNTFTEELDFSLLPTGIERLDLSNNNISRISRKEAFLPMLKTLNLSGNQLANISILIPQEVSLPVLEELHLSSNPLIEIRNPSMFSNIKKLRTLMMDRARLRNINELAFAPLKELETLNISYNRLRMLHGHLFDQNQKLSTLDLTDNSMSDVPPALRSISSIELLALDKNLFTSLRNSDFFNQTSLSHLFIRDCLSLWIINDFTFSDLPNLRSLYLNNNTQLKNISRKAFASYESQLLEGSTRDDLTTVVEMGTIKRAVARISFQYNPDRCSGVNDWLNKSEPEAPIDFWDRYDGLDVEIEKFIEDMHCEFRNEFSPGPCILLLRAIVIIINFIIAMVGLTIVVSLFFLIAPLLCVPRADIIPILKRAKKDLMNHLCCCLGCASSSNNATPDTQSSSMTIGSQNNVAEPASNDGILSATQHDIEQYRDNCAVCLDSMTAAKKLSCGHLFHESCLDSWLIQDRSCPKCRLSIRRSPETTALIS